MSDPEHTQFRLQNTEFRLQNTEHVLAGIIGVLNDVVQQWPAAQPLPEGVHNRLSSLMSQSSFHDTGQVTAQRQVTWQNELYVQPPIPHGQTQAPSQVPAAPLDVQRPDDSMQAPSVHEHQEEVQHQETSGILGRLAGHLFQFRTARRAGLAGSGDSAAQADSALEAGLAAEAGSAVEAGSVAEMDSAEKAEAVKFEYSMVKWNDWDPRLDTLLPIWQLKSMHEDLLLELTKLADELKWPEGWEDLNNQDDDHRKVVASPPTTSNHPTPTQCHQATLHPMNNSPPSSHYPKQVYYLRKNGGLPEERKLYSEALRYGEGALRFCGLQGPVSRPALVALEQGAKAQRVHQDAAGRIGDTPPKWSIFCALHNREIDFAIKDEEELKSISMVGGEALVFDAR